MASDTQPDLIGITVLYEGTPSTVDIVCVHGLGSTSRTCWKKGDILWLRDFLPKAIDSARVATFGFNSSIVANASMAKIKNHSRDLLQDLLDQRQGEVVPYLIYPGGIIVKQALVMAHQQSKFGDIKKATYGIVFLGTPHRGSTKIAKSATKHPRTHSLEALKENSQQLQDLSEQFTDLHNLFQIVSCFEQKKTVFKKRLISKREMVVLEFSAKMGIQGETLVAMDTDHHGICKFDDADDFGYIRVRNRIVELADKAPNVVKERFKASNVTG